MLSLEVMNDYMEKKEKVKEIKRTIGRLYTKGPRIINPKKIYKRYEKYQENYFQNDFSEESNSY